MGLGLQTGLAADHLLAWPKFALKVTLVQAPFSEPITATLTHLSCFPLSPLEFVVFSSFFLVFSKAFPFLGVLEDFT